MHAKLPVEAVDARAALETVMQQTVDATNLAVKACAESAQVPREQLEKLGDLVKDRACVVYLHFHYFFHFFSFFVVFQVFVQIFCIFSISGLRKSCKRQKQTGSF